MKRLNPILASLILALGFLSPASTHAETVFQTARGEAALTGEGKSAVEKQAVEVKTGPEGDKMIRLPGSFPQWGYVNYWFGMQPPAGQAILRFKLYIEDGATGDYAVYIKRKGTDPVMEKLIVPADAKKDSYVTVDVPVGMPEAWSGFSLKKIAKSENPSPWIDSVSVILP